jgi:5-methylcytosine-specific restriction endonuclease McrA
MNTHIDTARTLTDDALLDRVKGLVGQARATTAELIAHLAEVDRRGLHLKSGYGSMFAYCFEALGLSESEAYRRIDAARAAQRFPVILRLLAEGTVNLTAVKLLAPHLTADNHAAVLESARGRHKSEVEKIVARLSPAPDVATSIRKLPTPATAASSAATAASPPLLSAPTALHDVSPLNDAPPLTGMPLLTGAPLLAASPSVEAPPTTRAALRPAVVNALSPDRYKLQLTISGDTLAKLRRAKDMLRHAVPSGDESQIIDRALTLLLADVEKKKCATSSRPARPKAKRPKARCADATPTASRHVPAEVRGTVWARDEGQCAFVGDRGHRCQERALLEFHHVRPYAEGGPPTVENIQLRCRRHNRYEWELRSKDVRRLEDEWLRRQVAAGVTPWKAAPTGSGASSPAARPRASATNASSQAARPTSP